MRFAELEDSYLCLVDFCSLCPFCTKYDAWYCPWICGIVILVCDLVDLWYCCSVKIYLSGFLLFVSNLYKIRCVILLAMNLWNCNLVRGRARQFSNHQHNCQKAFRHNLKCLIHASSYLSQWWWWIRNTITCDID